MDFLRPPAVAGLFYPGTADDLRQTVARFLAAAPQPGRAEVPKAVVVPHAGYVYSGPVAAAAYRWLEPFRDRLTRVVLLGPAHRVAVRGLVLPGASAFETPLGRVPVEPGASADLAGLAGTAPQAHEAEHSLEVQLPFLQVVLGSFSLVPLVVGRAPPAEVAGVLDRLWGGPETLVVVSTDLSHYHSDDQARWMDKATAAAIESFRPVDGEQACGAAPLNGFLLAAQARGLGVRRTALATSGDTSGDRHRVVGYGSWVFFEGGRDGS
jgi:hypothetical protein